MSTEVEKYVLIQEYLNGKLSGSTLLDFEAKWKSDALFRQEVELHRLANEAIVDHYLLDVKTITRRVIRERKLEQKWWNWGLGLGTFIMGAILIYLLFPSNKSVVYTQPNLTPSIKEKVDREAKLFEKETKVKRMMPESATREESSNPAIPLVDNKTELLSPSIIVPMSQEDGKEEIPQMVYLPQEKDAESQTRRVDSPNTVESSPKNDGQQEVPQEKPKASSHVFDLVFNPQLGEHVNLPVEENFSGEFQVFDADGVSLFKCLVQNGFPDSWDGRANSGGLLTSGQYGFVLRSHSGDEKIGYITVVK